MPNMKSSVPRRVLSTVLSLVIALAPVTATAQEVGAQHVAQPPADAIEMARTAINLFERPNVPESFEETLRLLRTPGWHPELMEILGLDSEVDADRESLLASTTTGPPALNRAVKWAIIVGIVIAALAIFGYCNSGDDPCG